MIQLWAPNTNHSDYTWTDAGHMFTCVDSIAYAKIHINQILVCTAARKYAYKALMSTLQSGQLF